MGRVRSRLSEVRRVGAIHPRVGPGELSQVAGPDNTVHGPAARSFRGTRSRADESLSLVETVAAIADAGHVFWRGSISRDVIDERYESSAFGGKYPRTSRTSAQQLGGREMVPGTDRSAIEPLC